MVPKTKTVDLIKSTRHIANWFSEQASQSISEEDHWDHTIRSLALEEAADRIQELEETLKNSDKILWNLLNV